MYSNGPKIVTNSLILCLDAGSVKSYLGSGTAWTDISRNGGDGVLTNGPAFNNANGGNIIFDGANDFLANPSYTPAVNTVSIWLKLNSTKNGLIIGVGNNAYDSGQWSWSIFLYNGGFYLRGNPGPFGTTFSAPVGEWINWTMIRNNGANSCLFYKNGIFAGSSADSTLTNTYSGFRITGAGSVYAGFSLSTVLLYNRALSATEILQNYNATKGRFKL